MNIILKKLLLLLLNRQWASLFYFVLQEFAKAGIKKLDYPQFRSVVKKCSGLHAVVRIIAFSRAYDKQL